MLIRKGEIPVRDGIRTIRFWKKIVCSFLTSLVVIESGCFYFPHTDVTALDKVALTPEFAVTAPAKVYLTDGTIVVFGLGFKVEGDQIVGVGVVYPPTLSGAAAEEKKRELPADQKIPLTRVAAANTYTDSPETASEIGSFIMGLSGFGLWGGSIYCLACPKCCFGSCPTVYDDSSGKPVLEAELFSYSVSKLLEAADIDVLDTLYPAHGDLRLRVTNEAMETHHINQLAVEVIEHPAGTSVCASPGLGILPVGLTVPPDAATTVRGEDILDKLRTSDESFFRSGDGPIKAVSKEAAFDSFEVVKKVASTKRNVRMTIRYRNTLLTTILFYDVVLASQGLQALDWTARMNSDPVYASQFLAVYKIFSGIRIQEWNDGRWQPVAQLPDAGPLNWKTMAVDVPVPATGEIRLRLQFFPDNFMIDAIGFDLAPPAVETISRLRVEPAFIWDHAFRPRPEYGSLIEKDDGAYLITEPGDSFILDYQLPIAPEKSERVRSLAIASKGYYIEWIRGSWVRNDPAAAPFRLSDMAQTIRRLAASWLRDREFLEREFFRARIPLKKS